MVIACRLYCVKTTQIGLLTLMILLNKNYEHDIIMY